MAWWLCMSFFIVVVQVFFPHVTQQMPTCSADSALKCKDWSGLFWLFIYHGSSSSLHRSPGKSSRMKVTRFLFVCPHLFCSCCCWQSNSSVIGKDRMIAIYFFLHSGLEGGGQEDFVPEPTVVWCEALISVIICCLKMPAGERALCFFLCLVCGFWGLKQGKQPHSQFQKCLNGPGSGSTAMWNRPDSDGTYFHINVLGILAKSSWVQNENQ